jgi:hypothetical protein
MLMDCAKLPWKVEEIIRGLDEHLYTYEELMTACCIVPDALKKPSLPFEWNSLEYYAEGKTRLMHYTDMPTQPWVSNQNPSGHLWYRLLREAVHEGFVTLDELYTEVRKGHVSPELPRWAGLPAPPDVERLVKTWTPPYKRFAADSRTRKSGNAKAEVPAGSRGWLSGLKRLLTAR